VKIDELHFIQDCSQNNILI